MTIETREAEGFLVDLEDRSHQIETMGGIELPQLAPSPWRSLGKRLDYSEWVERDRFIELDVAILARQELEPQWNTNRRTISL